MIHRSFWRGVSAALLLVVFLVAAPVAAANTYTDPQGRFSFAIPDGYTPVETQLTPPFVAGYISPNPVGANFTVQIREATGTLDAATAAQQKRYASAPESQPGPVQQLKLGGQTAQRFDYFTSGSGGRYHVSLVLAINGGALYILTFTAQEQDYDALTSQTGGVLTSFAFLGTPPPVLSSQPSNGSAVYTDPQGRFSVTIPIDFQVSKDADVAKYAVTFDANAPSGALRASFIIDFQTIDSSPSINTVTSVFRNNLIDKKYTFVGEQAITLGGIPAYRFDATKTYDDGYKGRTIEVVTVKGNTVINAFFITDQGRYSEYAARAQIFLSSFAFGSNPNPAASASPASPTSPASPIPSPSAPPTAPAAPTTPGAPPPQGPTGGHDGG